jgi:hypothetical protein
MQFYKNCIYVAVSYCGLLRKSSDAEALLTADVCEPMAACLTDWLTDRYYEN